MNSKKIALIAIALWVVTIAAGVIMFVGGKTEKAVDGRQAVVLSAEERAGVLAEMRQLLLSVQGVVAGIEGGNMKAVSAAALDGGTKMMVDMQPGLMMKLPLAFKEQGVGVHKYFDTIAAEADKGASREKILSMLNSQLKNCVSCHAGYQFKTEN